MSYSTPSWNSGNLIIRPIEAHLVHKTELIGKMSPYVKLILGNEFKTTPVAKRAHLTPTWNTELVLRYNGEVSLRVEVWDKDLLTKDDLVGFGTFDLSQMLSSGQFMGDIPLYYKDRDAGTLRLSIQFQPDGSTYDPFTSQGVAKTTGQSQYLPGSNVGYLQGSQPVWGSQSVLPGSTFMGTGQGGETTFLPSQTLGGFTSVTPTPRETLTTSTLEPIIHRETQRFYEAPVYIHQRPVIHEKTVIIERPIITEKTIIEKEVPIIMEMPELHEKSIYQKMEPVVIRENPIVIKEDLSTNFANLNLQGEPIMTSQTEVRREAPVFMKEQTELFQKEIIHQRHIIHEKDIIFVEKPVFVEKPEIRERPILKTEAPSYVREPLISRSVRSDDLNVPAEALVHTDRVVVNEAPMFVKERPEIYERELIVEKPIIHEQPIVYSEREEIHEKPEFIEKRGLRVEQPFVEKVETVYVRKEEPVVQTRTSVLTTTQSVTWQGQPQSFNQMTDYA